jgi:hypothetical protein
MPATITARKLADFPAYQAAEAELLRLKGSEAATTVAIRQTEELLRQDTNRVLPDPKVSAELGRQREELATLQRAIGEQERRLSRARMEASRELCEAVKPQHDAALREMALALLACNKAALLAANIRDHLGDDDVSVGYLPMVAFPEIGQSTLDPCSVLSYFVRECLAHGFLNRRDVPADWLRRWGIRG